MTTANQQGWNASGQTLPGAAKFNVNISPEVRIPTELLGIDFLPKADVDSGFTETYTSRYNSDASYRTDYGYLPMNTDFSFGIGRRDKLFDIKLCG